MSELKNKLGIDLRTKISTIVAIGAYLNMLLATFDPSVIADNKTAMLIYQILSAIFALCAWVNSHYYNQNYTPEGITGTLITREMKEQCEEEQPTVEEPADSYIEESEVIADEV